MNNPINYDPCWLRYNKQYSIPSGDSFSQTIHNLVCRTDSLVAKTALKELNLGISKLFNVKPEIMHRHPKCGAIILGLIGEEPLFDEYISSFEHEIIKQDGYLIKTVSSSESDRILIAAKSDTGMLYGVFHLLRHLCLSDQIKNLHIAENPKASLRIINHWDNLDGSIERGYAGKSIFYENNEIVSDTERINDYARLLASIGINGIVINNVNVHFHETGLIDKKLYITKKLAGIFREYGILTYLSINYASPIQSGGLESADPCNLNVISWWEKVIADIYKEIPDFGGFLVKADSEHRPGPHSYGRDHATGANMLASILKPYGGLLIWRSFVYNCKQDWRDITTDRAKAAYDIYKPFDGAFHDNVILQIKNGPMDFQVREPVSPLLGAMPHTAQILEFQITQEYTGQQVHLCYLVPQWKEILAFDTYAKGKGSAVKRITDGSLHGQRLNGFAAVVNVGCDQSWTGHYLAQANLYGYGRLTWNSDLTSDEITKEWIGLTFGTDTHMQEVLSQMLTESWNTYESYTSPLGIGWMVTPGNHYGPSVDGYEYSPWGTYHRADKTMIGADRTSSDGTGFTGQYFDENKQIYESLMLCPEELLLFFHRLPYTHKLKSGKTLIQHIYDTHFDGADKTQAMLLKWESLREKIDPERFEHILARLKTQADHSKEWRDVINSYFYRKTGINDICGRNIY